MKYLIVEDEYFYTAEGKEELAKKYKIPKEKFCIIFTKSKKERQMQHSASVC